MKTSGN